MPSTSRANGVVAAPAAVRKAPEKWQFVNVNEPKKNQDKDVISLVRAHAMRSVRRNQRKQLTAQHQKTIKAIAPQSPHADSGVTIERSIQMRPNDWCVGDKENADWLEALSGMLSMLDFTNMGSSDGAEDAAECDRDADESGAFKRSMLGTHRTGGPQSLVGDGVLDPFNAMPIAGYAKYNSHVLNHFVTIVALNCLPVDQRKGQNPLTQTWLPYALQDPAVFLATLTFAEVHLEILSGNYKGQKALLHKCDSIKAINARLGDREHALSDETIGAVAMLAAMEAIVGNYKELRIHVNGLQKLVYMRGGLQSLGWGGILHTFISWQDLLSSAMMASTPRYEPTPYCHLVRGTLPYSDPIFSELGLSTEFCGEIATCFQNMRHLTEMISSWNDARTAVDMLSFSELRADIVHRLLSVANTKPALEMTNLDYHMEVCRLAALIYIRVALHNDTPHCPTVRILKDQLVHLIKRGEANGTIGVGARRQPTSITWAFFVSGIMFLGKEEEEWFAQRLAKGIRASGIQTWPEIEDRLRQICWLDKLNAPACRSLWNRVMVIHAEYWAAQVRFVASEWDRQGPVYWYPSSDGEAYTLPGDTFSILGTDVGPV